MEGKSTEHWSMEEAGTSTLSGKGAAFDTLPQTP